MLPFGWRTLLSTSRLAPMLSRYGGSQPALTRRPSYLPVRFAACVRSPPPRLCYIIQAFNSPTAMHTMRKIESQMIEAMRFARLDYAGTVFKGGNTVVTLVHFGIHGTPSYDRQFEVRLHGNLIAVINAFTGARITTAGWNTATTRSRLNALLTRYAPDYRVHSVKGECKLAKLVCIPSQERYGSVPCKPMTVATVDDELISVPG